MKIHFVICVVLSLWLVANAAFSNITELEGSTRGHHDPNSTEIVSADVQMSVDDIEEMMKKAIKEGVEAIPYAGKIASVLLGFILPKGRPISDIIMEAAEKMIDAKLIEEKRAEIRGFEKDLAGHLGFYRDCWKIDPEPGYCYVHLTNAESVARKIINQVDESPHKDVLFPFVVPNAISLLLIYQELDQHYDNAKLAKKSLRGVSEMVSFEPGHWKKLLDKKKEFYKNYFETARKNWMKWRPTKITVENQCSSSSAARSYIKCSGDAYVEDQVIGYKHKFKHACNTKYKLYEENRCPNVKLAVQKVIEARKRLLFREAIARELVPVLSPSFYLHLIGAKDSVKSKGAARVPKELQTLTFGPYSCLVAGTASITKREHFVDTFTSFSVTNSYTAHPVSGLKSRTGDSIDTLQFIYPGGKLGQRFGRDGDGGAQPDITIKQDANAMTIGYRDDIMSSFSLQQKKSSDSKTTKVVEVKGHDDPQVVFSVSLPADLYAFEGIINSHPEQSGQAVEFQFKII